MLVLPLPPGLGPVRVERSGDVQSMASAMWGAAGLDDLLSCLTAMALLVHRWSPVMYLHPQPSEWCHGNSVLVSGGCGCLNGE